MTRRTVRLAAALALVLAWPPHVASAATKESDQAYKDASARVWEATSLIFQCLASARSGVGPQLLYDADKKLGLALDAYANLSKLRDGKEFEPGDAYVVEVDQIKRYLGIDGKIKLEEEIIVLNRHEIDALRKQIADWHGKCETPVRKTSELLRLFEAKIRLERASQLSEIAFAQRLY